MYRLIRPLLFRLDPERAHRLALGTARLIQRLPHRAGINRNSALSQTVMGLQFDNPVGIAAGLDKNAVCIPFWERIGCGFVEIGSISAQPAPGNPKPRSFRLPADRALINRMGLNNDGARAVVERIQRGQHHVPLGINLVKTHVGGMTTDEALADFCQSYQCAEPVADYIALNISCPNTEDGKTFEDPGNLDALLDALSVVRKARTPLLIKLSPPESSIDRGSYRELLDVAIRYNIDGFIAANTSSGRAGLTASASRLQSIGSGGLSGAPLAKRVTDLVRFLFRETDGSLPIVGVGGIDSVERALERIRAGSSLIQVYTGLVYEGPGLINRLIAGIALDLDRRGVSIETLIGSDA